MTWIKCSERLPDGPCGCLVVHDLGLGDGPRVRYACYEDGEFDLDRGNLRLDWVEAWMPLPEYKPEGE